MEIGSRFTADREVDGVSDLASRVSVENRVYTKSDALESSVEGIDCAIIM